MIDDDFKVFKYLETNRLLYFQNSVGYDLFTLEENNPIPRFNYYFTEVNLTLREYLTAFCIADDLCAIDEEQSNGSFEFRYSILSGSGWVPYNQLSIEQLIDNYKELSIYKEENKVPPLLSNKGYSSLDIYLYRILGEERYNLINSCN